MTPETRGSRSWPGLGATIPRGVAVEDNGQNVYVAIADWVMVQSQDGGASFT